ncbi:hypothetical protein FHW84_003547 [Dyella sp. SG562]|uniref:DUF2523 family protein n=1 Tax=Dyella sp. SG562 TaxID=2587017 RepID=UPI00141D8AF2|nr:DUF2523 family protein [Dyella sp. SG562]NII74950.1 hypothetical protein [Dyella sp. SG562]
MPAILALLGRMLLWLVSTYAGQWVLKILVTLGLTVVTNKLAVPAVMALIQSYANGLPGPVYQAFGAIGMDVFCSMVISASIASTAGNMVLRRVNS